MEAFGAGGGNGNGQLGDGTTVGRTIPMPIPSLTSGVVQIAAGRQFALALKDDESVWAWGYNNVGQIGDNTSGTSRTVPTAVNGLGVNSNVVQIAASEDFYASYALQDDGKVWGWGQNVNGDLGINDRLIEKYLQQILS